jgi:hypothetical protein
MVCCDLPYGATNCKWDTCIDLQELWRHYRRITKPNSAIVLFAQTPFDKVLGVSNLDWLRYEKANHNKPYLHSCLVSRSLSASNHLVVNQY